MTLRTLQSAMRAIPGSETGIGEPMVLVSAASTDDGANASSSTSLHRSSNKSTQHRRRAPRLFCDHDVSRPSSPYDAPPASTWRRCLHLRATTAARTLGSRASVSPPSKRGAAGFCPGADAAKATRLQPSRPGSRYGDLKPMPSTRPSAPGPCGKPHPKPRPISDVQRRGRCTGTCRGAAVRTQAPTRGAPTAECLPNHRAR